MSARSSRRSPPDAASSIPKHVIVKHLPLKGAGACLEVREPIYTPFAARDRQIVDISRQRSYVSAIPYPADVVLIPNGNHTVTRRDKLTQQCQLEYERRVAEAVRGS